MQWKGQGDYIAQSDTSQNYPIFSVVYNIYTLLCEVKRAKMKFTWEKKQKTKQINKYKEKDDGIKMPHIFHVAI